LGWRSWLRSGRRCQSGYSRVLVLVEPGVFREFLELKEKPLAIVGEGVKKTRLTTTDNIALENIPELIISLLLALPRCAIHFSFESLAFQGGEEVRCDEKQEKSPESSASSCPVLICQTLHIFLHT